MIEEENLMHFISEEIFILEEKTKVYPADTNESSQVEEPSAPLTQGKEEVLIKSDKEDIQENIYDIVVLVLPMNSKDRELLEKLLKAIKKTEADIKLVDSFSEFKNNFKQLLSFGYLNELKHQVDGTLENYKVSDVDGGKKVLVSAPLSTLHDNNAEKGALWKCLQEMFL
ncbi:MAG: DNA polymerase III subunit psi [Cyclobacteriaceae bacterium]